MNSTFNSFFRLLIVARQDSPRPGLVDFLLALKTRPPRWEISRCRTVDSVLGQLSSRCFDALVLDEYGLASEQVADLVGVIRARHPAVAILVVCGLEQTVCLDKLYEAGAQGLLNRADLRDELFFEALHAARLRQAQANLVTRDLDSLQRRFDDQVGYLRGLVDKTQDGIVIVDQKGMIRFVNPSATQLFGRSATKLIGSYFGYPLSGDRGIEISIPRGETTLVVEMRVSTIEWENQVSFLASLRDVTKYKSMADSLKLAEAAAQKASQMKSDFLATMSHEIRTPLNGLLGMARLMRETALSEAQSGLIDSVQSSGEILLTLINDILDLSKIEAGMLEFEHRKFNLPEVVRETINLYAHLANSKSLLLVSEIESSVPDEVAGDKVRFRQVLGNLVSNALKYTEVGTVKLKVSAVRGEVGAAECRLVFEVQDTGVGIPQSRFADLFQPFRQIGKHVHASGTGLGLSICKRLVSLMGGEIAVESGVDVGSTFRFQLPFREAVYLPSLFTSAATYSRRVLIVSERVANLAVYSQLFASGGFEPTTLTLPQLLDGPALPEEPWAYDLLVADMQGVSLPAGWQSLLRRGRASGLPIIRMQVGGDDLPAKDCRELTLSPPVHHVNLIESAKYLLSDPMSRTRREPQVASWGERRDGALPKKRPGYTKRILIAEDNPVNQQVAQRFLALLGFESDSVVNGQEAFRQALTVQYALILMDCRMPEMDGIQACRLIRSMEEQVTKTPIVALTANAMQEDMLACEQAGMNGFLAKPIRLEDLARELQRLVPDAFAPAREPGTSDSGGPSDRVSQVAAASPADSSQARQPTPTFADLEAFRALGQGVDGEALDQDFLQEILSTYEDCAPPRLVALSDAVQTQDGEAIRSLAHSLKGSSANLGATGVALVCADLERLVKSGAAASPEIHVLLDQLHIAYDGALRELKTVLAPPSLSCQ